MPNKFLLLLPFFFMLSCSDTPKQTEEKKQLHDAENLKSELSLPYFTFSKGYTALNSEIIGSSYTEDAILINVYKDAEPKSYKGRKGIANFFSENFEQAKSKNVNLKIIFKISERQVFNKTVLDNGYYKLEITDQNKTTNERYGKFSIVLRKESGDWKFFVDTNASSTKEEYDNAKSI